MRSRRGAQRPFGVGALDRVEVVHDQQRPGSVACLEGPDSVLDVLPAPGEVRDRRRESTLEMAQQRGLVAIPALGSIPGHRGVRPAREPGKESRLAGARGSDHEPEPVLPDGVEQCVQPIERHSGGARNAHLRRHDQPRCCRSPVSRSGAALRIALSAPRGGDHRSLYPDHAARRWSPIAADSHSRPVPVDCPA